jgi:tetratricopeptide (TPR) repeat protein
LKRKIFIQPLSRFGCAEPSVYLWLILFYTIRFVLYLMPVFRQTLGSWTELEVSLWYAPASLIGFLLLYTWFNRIPEAGAFWRWIWRWGRAFLMLVYLWSLGVLVWLNSAVFLRMDHRFFDAAVILFAIDLLAMAYLAKSEQVRAVFAAFPQSVDLEAQRNEAKEKAASRQQLMRDARLNAPIAQTPEQQQLEAHWRAEISSQPTSALPWLELGVLAYQCGQQEQALTLMEEALALEPSNPLVLRNLCELLRQKGRLAKALDYGRQAVEAAPSDEISRLNLAQALVDNRDVDLAIAQYHRLLEVNPHHVQSWLNLAALLQHQGRKEDAVAACEAVLLIAPGHAQALAFKQRLL